MSMECHLSEIRGVAEQMQQGVAHLAMRQAPQSLRVRLLKMKNEQESAGRRLGERGFPGRGNSMHKGLKAESTASLKELRRECK